MSAREVRGLLREGKISPLELLETLEHRIAAVDGPVNALPTLCFERARDKANSRDLTDLPLAGLPVAIKDLVAVAGVRTTWGSQIFADCVPEKSDLLEIGRASCRERV